MRRRCQRNSVSGVTSHPARLGRASAAAIAPSKLRSASLSSGRSIWRRSTASWWRNTMISRSFERPERTASRASDANNRYKIRYTTNQHRPASRQVNYHGRVSGTHTPDLPWTGVVHHVDGCGCFNGSNKLVDGLQRGLTVNELQKMRRCERCVKKLGIGHSGASQ